jgi:hypothetical protein
MLQQLPIGGVVEGEHVGDLVVFVDQIEFFQDCGIVLKSVLANLESKKKGKTI